MNTTTASEAPTTFERDVRPFGFRDKLGYMFGDFGNDFTFILQSTFFMIFYTNVVGINPGHVGILLLVARVFDAFTDVVMGIIVDRLPNSRAGYKFKRWVKWIAIPVAIASALMYMSFVADFDSYAAKVAWMTATYFLWGSICYSAINIPYGSMASVVSSNPDDRSHLSAWRSTGANLANLVISSILPLVVYVTNEAGVSVLSGDRMMWSAIVCSVLAVVCYAILYMLIEERVVEDGSVQKERVGISRMLGLVLSNRALLGLIAAALLLLLSFMFLGGMLGYLFLEYFRDGRLQSPASFIGLLPSFILIVLSPWLAKRFGKAEVGIVAMLTAGTVLLAAYILKIDNPVVWIGFYAIAMFAVNTSTSSCGHSSPMSLITRRFVRDPVMTAPSMRSTPGPASWVRRSQDSSSVPRWPGSDSTPGSQRRGASSRSRRSTASTSSPMSSPAWVVSWLLSPCCSSTR